MNIEQLAAEHNLDQGALACLMVYLQEKLVGTPQLAKAFQEATPAQRNALISRGVRAWYEHSQAWLHELRDNRTERAQAARAEITEQVYMQVRERQAAAVQARVDQDAKKLQD